MGESQNGGPRPRVGLEKPPEQRLGVYKTLSDVPPRSRLADKSGSLPHDDPWEAYMDHKEAWSNNGLSDHRRGVYDRVGGLWKEHMAEYDRYPALPDPEHVEAFFEKYADLTRRTLYTNYLSPLNGWFKWMRDHVDYPHTYSPLFMAAHEGGLTFQIYRMAG